MKSLLVLLIVCATVGTVSATFLTDNGDFEATAPGEGWNVWSGGAVTAIEQDSGGNPGQFVSLNNGPTGWAGWYNQNGVGGELNVLGIPAGTTVTVQCDMKSLGGNLGAAGLKAESWDETPAKLDETTSGWPIPITTSWASYSIDYTLNISATRLVVSMMNLASDITSAAHVGYDNIQILIPGGTPALRPIPYVGALLPDNTTAITWENPDPKNPSDTVTAAAYLLESDVELTDPNVGPGDLGVVELTVTGESADVTGLLTVDKYYYWRVDTTDPNGGGPVTTQGFTWDFKASGDSIPVVDAGVDQYLVTEGTGMVLSLDATVTDDEDAGPVSITWTDITADGDKDPTTEVTFGTIAADGDVEVTLANGGSGVVTGYYEFEIEVNDGVNDPVTDQVIIGVYGTCAEAADADPDDDYDITGDLNLDCKKDLADFAIFAAGWLDQSDRYQP